MSYYGHKSIPDAKFECDSSSGFGDMTSQKFLRKKGRNHHIQLLPLENELNFKKKLVFMSRMVLLDPKLTPHVNFSNFQAEEIFSFCKFLGLLDEKRTAVTLLIDQFC